MGLFDFLKKKARSEELDPLRGLMNLGHYTVSGTNPETKRSKTVVVDAKTTKDAIARSGLVDATAREDGWGVPSESHIDYFIKNGVDAPSGITAVDAQALIYRVSRNEKSAVAPELVIAAAEQGIAMSFLVGPKQYERIMENHNA